MILKFAHCLGICYIAFQCSHKRIMILCDYRGVKIKSDNDDEKMPSFKDANNDEVEYLVESESLMVRCALNVQVKENELK